MLSDDELAAIAELAASANGCPLGVLVRTSHDAERYRVVRQVPRLVAEVKALRAEIMWYREELHGYHVAEALRWSKTAPETENCPRCAALDDRAPRECG